MNSVLTALNNPVFLATMMPSLVTVIWIVWKSGSTCTKIDPSRCLWIWHARLVPRLCFYQTRSAWSVDQGSNKNHSPAYNFAPTVTKFCVMWEGLSLPHGTKFGNCRCKIVDSRAFPSWSLIHGLRWSGLIKAEPAWITRHAWWYHETTDFIDDICLNCDFFISSSCITLVIFLDISHYQLSKFTSIRCDNMSFYLVIYSYTYVIHYVIPIYVFCCAIFICKLCANIDTVIYMVV